MALNPRYLAFGLALIIAIANGILCRSISEAPFETWVLASLASFILAFFLVYFAIEWLIINELKKSTNLFEKVRRKDFSPEKKDLHSPLEPIRQLNDEISRFADMKQKEIDQLNKLETYRREFLADVSHELKTPIFAAQGFIHTLLDGAMEDPEVRQKFLKKAAKSLDRLDELVQDLMVISDMETGTGKLKKTRVDVPELVKEVFDQLEKKAQKRNIVLHLEESENEHFTVLADKARLFQVMQNLVENGIKYGNENGSVQVRATRKKNDLRLEVADNGPGIPKEDRKRIFERFYRVDKSRSKEKGGSGLGLAIVKHILEAHDSKIKIKSKLGEGTRFWFKLPLAVSD